jgi:hypothetical protein
MLSACAASQYDQAQVVGNTQWPPTEYRHTVSTTALRQYWNCSRTGDGMRLDGLAANIWNSQPVRFMEWTLAGVDKDGRTVSSATVSAKVLQLWANQYTTYQIDVPTKGSEAQFDLYYTYQFWDSGKDAVPLAALDWDGPVLLAQQNARWYVLDACSDTQHLAR